MPHIPSLIGVIHLAPLPGSPRFGDRLSDVIVSAVSDARALSTAGFDAIMVENFGDAPFFPEQVPPITIASMTTCILAVRDGVAPEMPIGVNVLRNDALSALSIAAATNAAFIRINVHTSARVADQGMLQGRAHETLRARRALGANVLLLCDVDVKHSAALAARSLSEETEDLCARGLADAVLVTGSRTGHATDTKHLEEVLAVSSVPVLVASGVTEHTLPSFVKAHGVIVGSALRANGRAGEPIDPQRARDFARAFRAAK